MWLHREDERPFAFAGLYGHESAAIITTDANSLHAPDTRSDAGGLVAGLVCAVVGSRHGPSRPPRHIDPVRVGAHGYQTS